jgi:hypothetical protein
MPEDPQKRTSDRFTKSIVLAGGVQDDVPEFLKQLPSLAYIENGRFRKENEVEKTLPFTELEGLTGEPTFVAAVKDGFIIGLTDGVEEHNDSFTPEASFENKIFHEMTRKEKICSTTAIAGACNFTWVRREPVGADPFYVIAYETRVGWHGGSSETNYSKVHIETFSETGKLLGQKVFNGLTPVVNISGDGLVLVHYAIGGGSIYCYQYDTDSTIDLGLDVYIGYAPIDAIFDDSSNLPDHPFGQTLSTKGYNSTRFGFLPSAINAQFQVYYPGDGNGSGALLYIDEATKALTGVRLQNNGDSTLVTIPLFEPENDLYGTVPHDVRVIGSGGTSVEYWFLYSIRDGLGEGSPQLPTTSLWAIRTDYLLENPQVIDLKYKINGTIINAKFADGLYDPGHGVSVAFTYRYGLETAMDYASNDNAGVVLEYGRIANDMAYEETARMLDHVLTSVPAYIGEPVTFSMYFTCQQMVTSEPYAPDIVTGVTEIRTSIPISILKPVSTILVKASIVNDFSPNPVSITPIAIFDVNSSKYVNPSMQEQPLRLSKIQNFAGEELVYLNRQLLQGEDGSKYLDEPNRKDQVAPLNLWQKQNFTTGEYRGNVYSVAIEADGISGTSFGDGAIIGSGLPLMYVAGELSEICVLEQPEILSIFQTDDENTSNGQMCWCQVIPTDEETEKWITVQIVVGFTDPLGYVHRSAPSFPVFVRGAGPDDSEGETRTLTFTKPLALTNREFFVEVYENKYGEVPQLAAVDRCNPKSYIRDEVIYYGAMEYSYEKEKYPIRNSEFVYTTGGVLASDPWPDYSFITETSRRLFIASEDTVYYTKLLEQNTAPEMNALLNIPLGRSAKITALGSIDDKVIVFEKDKIHAIYGDGPDNTGIGDFVVDRIQTTVGCESQTSLVQIPEGLIFYSDISEEFHILTRDFEVVNIGSPVMDLSAGITINASTLFPKEEEVRWYANGPLYTFEFGVDPDTGPGIPTRPPRPRYQNVLPHNAVLVFNYGFNKWTILTNQPAEAVTIVKNELLRVTPSNVYVTTENWETSGFLKYRTPWVPVQDLQNFGRVDKAILLGQYLSSWVDNGEGFQAGDIKVTTRYDYEEFGNFHTYRWRANKDLSSLQGNRLQFSIKPGQPKCQSIQFTVEEIPTEKLDDNEPDYTNGRGFVLSGLDMLCKIKRGFGDKSLGQLRSK